MADMKFQLPYGNTLLEAEIPQQNIAYVLETRDQPGIPDETNAILQALHNPTGCAPLLDSVTSASRVVIIVTDATRPCPDDRILPVLLSELGKTVPIDNITILIALGLHEPMTESQMKQKYGEAVFDKYRILNHDPEKTVFLGTTSGGVPVEVNRVVIEADIVISTGFIEPHFFAGYSGGRKSIAPGVSSARAIRKNHGYDMLCHPMAKAGVLKGNPIHEDMVEQANMTGLDFIVNVLLNRKREITHIFAGNHVMAHETGCLAAREVFGIEVPSQVDISIVTNSGAPLDLDLYQTCKGIDTASQITRPGGIIIAVSSCHSGIGPASFQSLHAQSSSPFDILKRVRNDECGVGWQNQVLARIQEQHEIYLVSNLSNDLPAGMMITPAATVEEAVSSALAKLGKSASIGIIPEGPLVLPYPVF